jgi:hypothetical protein
MTPLISVIHPSRGRSKRALNAYKNAINNAFDSSKIEYILSVEPDMFCDYHNVFNSSIRNNFIYVSKENKTAIEAINSGAKEAKANILMVLSDDFDDMPLNWDLMILEAVKDKKFWVLKTFDKTQEWIITMPIMDRAFYNKFGYIYNPAYTHMFCYTELSSICDMLDCVITRNDIVFPHNHYTNGFEKDEINTKNDLSWKQGESMYFKRMKENFGLNESEIKSGLKHKPHLEWIEIVKHKYLNQ